MKIENFKIGQKVRAFIKSDNKIIKVNGKIVSNSAKTKTLKLENKKCIYECEYKEIKNLTLLSRSILKKILILLLLLFSLLVFWYRTAIFHTCGFTALEDVSEHGIWTCKGLWCECDWGWDFDDYDMVKPIIYLYPTKKTEVSVKVGYPEKFTHTYPYYTDGWNVIAQPNGDLQDVKTGRNLYALYWEGRESEINKSIQEGFIVQGKDTISFLEDKLAQLGLSEREANEFIIYWLPRLESQNYNFIRFKTMEEQNKSMPLLVNPKPDTIIRVMMEYKHLNKKIEIKEQILPETPERKGFTLVEWGGTELKD